MLAKFTSGVAALVTLFLVTGAEQTHAQNFCGPMDVVLVVDDTGSMGPAIDSVRIGLTNIIAAADAASGGDVRFGLVTFGVGIEVDRPFSCQVDDVISAVNALTAAGGAGTPEDSDEALRYVVAGAAQPSCTVTESRGVLGAFRAGALKIVVLVTDALPAGCDDTFTVGVDDVNASAVATLAASSNVLISAILVGTGDATLQAIMQNYASATGGFYTSVPSTGDGTGAAIQSIINSCGGGGPVTNGVCVTRPARYWFTHTESADPSCVTLKRALEACGGIGLGFISLPVEYRTPDYVKDAEDALIEALGLYYRSRQRTGEDRGTQSLALPTSRLCRARKLLAIELIAATANLRVLGTAPGNCTFNNGVAVTNFPFDLLQQGRSAARSDDPVGIAQVTALLRKFNGSGQTNDFPIGQVECSEVSRSTLRRIARDPTTQLTCPGVNDSCETAQAVNFPALTDIFSRAVFTSRANLSRFADDFPGRPSCGGGGLDAVWKINPSVGVGGRPFTVSVTGNGFGPLVSVWSAPRGSCSNVSEVVCGTDTNGLRKATVTFRADGTNTYFIVTESADGAVGSLTLKVTSP